MIQKRIFLAGNPNCGKTTLFNALTGLNYKVANYPGVTVEKKEGELILPNGEKVTVVDLPGTYSLSAHSLDETIATEALCGKIEGEAAPDLIVSVVDASNLERNLFLTTQLLDLKLPLIVVLNLVDVADDRGIKIRKEILAKNLNTAVFRVVAHKQKGVDELKQEIIYQLNVSKPVEVAVPPEYTSDEITERYQKIHKIVEEACVIEPTKQKHLSDRVDWIVTHQVWGTLIFVAMMALIFQSVFLWATFPMELIDKGVASFGEMVRGIVPEGRLQSLLVDGVVSGVGSVLIFIPQIALLFFFLSLLEDSGYLSRAAFLMDRIMRHVGLQGRSFIPLLSSFACAVPGIMSTRSIPSFADRLATILVAPLMSCSARLPVFTLLIAAFIPSKTVWGIFSLQGLVLLTMYLLGIIAAAVVALALKRTLLKGKPTMFVMELSLFRLPSLTLAVRTVWDRIKLFIESAGTVILACSIILWFLATYPGEDIQHSFAGMIGHAMEPLIRPLGYNWEIGIGILASFAAREVFISALATVYNIADPGTVSAPFVELLQHKARDGSFTTLTALSLMVFFVFACQCMSTLAVVRRETGSWRWVGFMFAYMTALAYIGAFITYQVGSWYIR